MMFATVDDLDGAVEIVVFEKTLAAVEAAPRSRRDRARPRPRRPQGGRQESASSSRTSSASTRPTPRSRRPRSRWRAWRRRWRRKPIRLRVDAARLQPTVIDELRDLFERYPGDAEFVLEMDTRSGLRCLRFGDGYKIAGARRRPAGRAARPAGPGARRRARRGVTRVAVVGAGSDRRDGGGGRPAVPSAELSLRGASRSLNARARVRRESCGPVLTDGSCRARRRRAARRQGAPDRAGATSSCARSGAPDRGGARLVARRPRDRRRRRGVLVPANVGRAATRSPPARTRAGRGRRDAASRSAVARRAAARRRRVAAAGTRRRCALTRRP